MDNNLTIDNLLFCYNSLKKLRTQWSNSSFELGLHIGYLEAGLKNYGYLETIEVGNDFQIKRKVTKSNKWWKLDKVESRSEAIIRMTEKMFKEKNIIV